MSPILAQDLLGNRLRRCCLCGVFPHACQLTLRKYLLVTGKPHGHTRSTWGYPDGIDCFAPANSRRHGGGGGGRQSKERLGEQSDKPGFKY